MLQNSVINSNTFDIKRIVLWEIVINIANETKNQVS